MVAWVTVDDTTPAPLLHRRHIVVVLDVSGSMGSLATAKSEDGSALEDGFTLLNLVQHATKTICHALAPHDRLSIVAFDTNAVLELPPTIMDAAGKANADRVIASLRPKGSTNLWAGIAMVSL
jgi:Mg-chelatase subunit ChlD